MKMINVLTINTENLRLVTYLPEFVAMGLILYVCGSSLATRSVLITAAALGIHIEKKTVDMGNLEHLSPEFLKVSKY